MPGKRGRPKGLKLNQATKNQIAKSKTGYVHDQETRDKIANSLVKYFDGIGRKLNYSITGTCPSCEQLVFAKKQQVFCDDCTKLAMTGEYHWNWKGGIGDEYKTFFNSIKGRKKFTLWRQQVFERDNYTCQMCAGPGNCAHHLIDLLELKDNPELLYSVDIGLTLCASCHGQLHWNEKNLRVIE